MSSNSIFSSIDSQKRWVLEMDKNFPQEHIVDIDFDTPSCVFRVPKSLSETKPEAYAPQLIGLGPYHHLRPDLYMMHKQKLAAVRKFLKPKKLNKMKQVVQALMQWEPVLRACYDHYLDLDAEALAWIVAIDGFYLLQYLRNSEHTGEVTAYSYPDMESLAGDIIMLENQIPAVLLTKIRRVLELCSVDDDDDDDQDEFCRAHSPLKLCSQRVITGDMSQAHLLHRMYHLVVNNRGIIEDEIIITQSFHAHVIKESLSGSMGLVRSSLEFAGERGLPVVGTAAQILSFIENVPWGRILSLFKKGDPDSQSPLVEEIDIPLVSEMTEIAGITFFRTRGGIRDVHFNEEEKKFYLPVITLNTHSEIILRNLVAYEAASAKPGSTPELAEYVDLMCGIIDTSKDVDILKKAKIIEGELPDEEIVRIFNGIRKSTGKKDRAQTNIEQAIDNVNKKYDDVGSVKAKKLLVKYFSATWKFISVLVAVVVVVMLTLQAFCSVFGCGRWFGKSTMVQSYHLLYADQ